MCITNIDLIIWKDNQMKIAGIQNNNNPLRFGGIGKNLIGKPKSNAMKKYVMEGSLALMSLGLLGHNTDTFAANQKSDTVVVDSIKREQINAISKNYAELRNIDKFKNNKYRVVYARFLYALGLKNISTDKDNNILMQSNSAKYKFTADVLSDDVIVGKLDKTDFNGKKESYLIKTERFTLNNAYKLIITQIGAKNINTSFLSPDEIYKLITNGQFKDKKSSVVTIEKNF